MLFFIIGGFMLLGCSRVTREPKRVDLTKNLIAVDSVHDASRGAEYRFAVATMITPDETLASYKTILDYIAEKLDIKYKLVMRDSYAQVNELLENGALDLAFICTGAYVDIADKADVELLAAPIIDGRMSYHSLIIVNADSGAESFEQLRGGTFAFTDPLSNSGRLYPLKLLTDLGVKDQTFFSSFFYTYSHSDSIEMTAAGDVDAAAVDSLVFKYLMMKKPALKGRIRIINTSPPFATPPFVVSSRLDKRIKERLAETLFTMHEDERGGAILRGVGIERFGPVDDAAYDGVREMTAVIAGNGAE